MSDNGKPAVGKAISIKLLPCNIQRHMTVGHRTALEILPFPKGHPVPNFFDRQGAGAGGIPF